MRTENNGRTHYVLISVALLMVLSAARAAAQQAFDLPAQPSQRQAPSYAPPTPMATPIPYSRSGSDVRTLPQIAPQLPAGPSSTPPTQPYAQPQITPPPAPVYQSEPVLPAVFRGCWEGRVEYLDSLERLRGGAKLGFWTPKTYRICYRRSGDGPFVLIFTEAGIEQSDRITNAEGRMTLVSSDGQRYASMRSDLDFDEYRSHASYFGAKTFAVHELADLDCRIEADGMHVKGIVTGWREGSPWFLARWHTVFVHEGEPPERVEAPPGGIPE